MLFSIICFIPRLVWAMAKATVLTPVFILLIIFTRK